MRGNSKERFQNAITKSGIQWLLILVGAVLNVVDGSLVEVCKCMHTKL